MSVQSGKSSSLKEQRLEELLVTVQKVLYARTALDTISHAFVEQVGTDFVDSATPSVLTVTGHAALPGYLIRFTSGTYNKYIASVISVTSDTITLGQDLPTAPSAADSFEILRYRPPVLDANGALTVSGIVSGGGGGSTATVVTKTADYTATTEDVILCDATGASFTITLPSATTNSGRIYVIKKIDTSANTVTVDADGTETIDGDLTFVLVTEDQSIRIVSDASNWWVI